MKENNLHKQYPFKQVKEVASVVRNVSAIGKVILILGQPGTGKSVFMKQLYDELNNEIDYLTAIRAEFLKETDSPEQVYNEFKKVENEDKPKVLLLDSLDILAYSRRKELQEWLYYIDKMKEIKGMTVVCASRGFEANHLYPMNAQNWSQKITIEPLPNDFIKEVLAELNYDFNSLSNQMQKFLSVPLHLRVAVDIIQSGGEIKDVRNIEGLYTKLMEVLEISSNEINVLSALSELMIENRTTCLFYPSLNAELLNMIRQMERPAISAIIQIDDKYQSLSFTHQTFIDYFAALKVINENKSLKDFIIEHNQSLFIRPTLRYIISFLRSSSKHRLVEELSNVFFKNSTQNIGFIQTGINFHIKASLLAEIASWEDPDEVEANFLIRIFNDMELGKDYTIQFFDKRPDISWYYLLKDKYIISLLKENSSPDVRYQYILGYIADLAKQIPSEVLELLKIVLNKKPDSSSNWLFFKTARDLDEIELESKDQETYADIFENVIAKGHLNDSMGIMQICKGIAKYFPDRALNVYLENLKKEIEGRKTSHSQRELLDTFSDILPLIYEKEQYKTLSTLTDFLETIFPENYSEDKLWDFPEVTLFNESEQKFGLEALYSWYKDCILQFCAKFSEDSADIVKKLEESKWKTQKQLSFLCKLKNPELFKSDIIDFINKVLSDISTRKIEYDNHNLFLIAIKDSFRFIPEDQKNTIIKNLLGLCSDNREVIDYWVWQPLSQIPEDLRCNELAKKMSELKNKYNLPEYKYSPHEEFGGAQFAKAPYSSDELEKKGPEELYNFLIENRALSERWDFETNTFYGGAEMLSKEASKMFSKNLSKYKSVIDKLSRDPSNDLYLEDLFYQISYEKIDAEEVSWLVDIIKSVYKRENLGLSIISALIGVEDYLTENLVYEIKDVLLFLSESKNPEKDEFFEYRRKGYANDAITEGINSVRGRLAELLLRLAGKSRESWLFEALNKLSKDDRIGVRAALIYFLPLGLKPLGWDKCFELFSNAFKKGAEEYGRIITDFLQHTPKEKYGELSEIMSIMKANLQGALGIEYAKLMTIFYLRGMIPEEDLIDLLKDKDLNKTGFNESIKILANQLQYKEVAKKSFNILSEFIVKENVSSENAHLVFLKARPEDLQMLEPLLKKFIEDKNTKMEDIYYLLEYLEKSLLNDPLCVFSLLESLLKNLINSFYEQGNFNRAFFSKAPINIINTVLECYPDQEQRALEALDYLIKLNWTGLDEFLNAFDRM